MRGFILNIRKAKNEDIIVTVLSNYKVENYYRFFGARHSIIQVGNFIDFEVQESKSGFMPQLRRVSHLSFPWIFSTNHMLIWQNFIKLFEPHLRDTVSIDSFYFDLLFNSAEKWNKQNPKRLAVEAYIQLLENEGRLCNSNFCFVCEKELKGEIGLMRAYIPVHSECIYSYKVDKKDIFQLFSSKSTINLDDKIVEWLYITLLKGL